jgi:hypothetical protein
MTLRMVVGIFVFREKVVQPKAVHHLYVIAKNAYFFTNTLLYSVRQLGFST